MDDKQVKDQICEFVNENNPELVKKISLYEDSPPLFDLYNLEKTLKTCLEKKVWLPSEGFYCYRGDRSGNCYRCKYRAIYQQKKNRKKLFCKPILKLLKKSLNNCV